ncbi:MAG: alpha/beta fold hydrolase [Caldilineaceae bacterium]
MANQLYALLVGIDRYANPAQAPHLRGCVADVEGTYGFLTYQLGVPQSNIRLLTARMDASEAPQNLATRDNIIRGWREHLAQAGQGDQVFFNYSGHGARARAADSDDPSGYNETMVPHDSRTPGIYDIIDKELATLIEEVEQRGAQVTLFLDCCHSGGGSRAVEDENTPRVRECTPDERIRPQDTLLPGLSASFSGASTRSTRSAPSGWVPLGNHVLLAGCRDVELSNEYRAPETGQWQGATTYFFHKALASYRPGITWAEIYDFVQVNVHAVYPAQTPQLEGPSNVQLFGGVADQALHYFLVTEVDGDQFVKINGGVPAGLGVGARMAIYPPSSDLSGDPLAQGEIAEVKVDHAWIKLDQPTTIDMASRARVTSFAYADQTLAVAIEDADLRDQLRAQNNGDGPSAFLYILADGESLTPQYRVAKRRTHYVIQDASGAQVVEEMPPATAEGAAQLVKNLEHLAFYKNIVNLTNPVSTSSLQGAVTIENVDSYTQSGRGQQPLDPQPLRNRGGENVLAEGQGISFTLRNNSAQDVFVTLFDMNPNFGVSKLYPARVEQQRMAAGAEIPISFRVSLDNPNLARGRSIFKVIATVAESNFSVLELPDLNKGEPTTKTRSSADSALGRLLNAVRVDGTRKATLDMDETDDEWTTAQIEVTIEAAGRQAELRPGETSATLDAPATQVTVKKPSAFSAVLKFFGLSQSTRGADAGVAPPPGLESPDAAPYFSLLELGAGTRAASAAPAVLELESEPAQFASITPESPLELNFSVADEPDLAGILPIAHDGEFYYVAGASTTVDTTNGTTDESGDGAAGTRAVGGGRQISVRIDSLPTPVDTPSDEETGETRDIKRTLRLFFYKVTGQKLPSDTGLRRGDVDANGKAVYAPITAAEVANAQKVVLMIHGITADTVWLVEKVWPFVRDLAGYDLCLTYDYESFGTGILANGITLHQALTVLGFGADDGKQLDIFAHSMGTQISRALVELSGGAAYVDRVFMGGPPNAGSPLAKARKVAPWLGTALVNLAGAVPASMLASWALNKFIEKGEGLSDLDPAAEFYAQANMPDGPTISTPYFVQAGDNSGDNVDWNRLYRSFMHLTDATLDAMFGGDNDIAVGLNSAQVVRGSRWPHTTYAQLPLNHFRYFYSPEGQALLRQWLANG